MSHDQGVLLNESLPLTTEACKTHFDNGEVVKEGCMTSISETPSADVPTKKSVTVKVISGNDHGTFTVFIEPICHYSPVFDALFKTLSAEAKGTPVEIHTKSYYKFFGALIHWLYHQALPAPNRIATGVRGLISIWILAGELQIPRLQNEAIRALVSQPEWSLKPRGVQAVLCLVGRDSLLVRLLVHMRAFVPYSDNLADNIDSYPKEFVADIALTIYKKFMEGNLSREIDISEFLVEEGPVKGHI